MAVEDAPLWARCTADASCVGVQARPDGPCLAHLDGADMTAALERLDEQDPFDARGVVFTDNLLGRVLEAFSKEQAGRPVFRVHARFTRATFPAGADFSRAAFTRGTSFREAVFQGDVRFTGGVTFQGVDSLPLSFAGATFAGRAWFDGATFDLRVLFDGVNFQGDVSFAGATFVRRTMFNRATFLGDVSFRGVTIGGNAGFIGATFEQARQLGPLAVGQRFVLDDAVFRQRVRLEAAASEVSCSGTRFLAGVHLRLRWARVVLEDANLAGPSILTGTPVFADLDEGNLERGKKLLVWKRLARVAARADGQPWLASLCRADVAGLAVADVDLRACLFTGAHNLDRLRLESPKGFATTPGPQVIRGWAWPAVWWWTRRQTLAEEHTWRAKFEHGVRQAGWHTDGTWLKPAQPRDLDRHPTAPGATPRKTSFHLGGRLRRSRAERALRSRQDVPQRREQAREIANLYRALRKGYEDNRNEPGAADFYYGEMELRREATPPSVERAILWLYWLVSGYGLRAWRALAAVVGGLVLGALLLEAVGFAAPRPAAVGAATTTVSPDTSFVGALLYSARTVIGLPHDPQPLLTRWGDVLQISLRITVPVLLGLAVLSIRGRVKR
jgi:uncharacterized protein YjbI with pentapeptide repeats